MIGVNGVGVLKKEEYLASPSRFQNFDEALNELTHMLYEDEYYNTPNSSIFILYNLKLHRFQTKFNEEGISEHPAQFSMINTLEQLLLYREMSNRFEEVQ
jgi:hypothetical protein